MFVGDKSHSIINEVVFLSFAFFSVASFSFLPINVSYVVTLLGLLLFLFLLFAGYSADYCVFQLIALSFLIFCLQLYGYYHAAESLSVGMGFAPNGRAYLSIFIFFASCLTAPLLLVFLRRCIHCKNEYFILLNKLCFLMNIYFGVELLSRLLNYDSGEHGFYVFKSSVFYLDSNFVGLILICYYSFLQYLNKRCGVQNKKSILFVFVLIVFTFSRSAWLSLLFYHFSVRFYHFGKLRLSRLHLFFCLIWCCHSWR